MILAPTPEAALVCSVCQLPWQTHRRSAQARFTHEAWDSYWGDEDESPTVPVATDGDVTLEDCVAALQDRFRGPAGATGAVGPMGAMGPAGPTGATGTSA